MITGILNIFAHSPFKPLQNHMQVVHECTTTLAPFVEAVQSENWQTAKALLDTISGLEEKADHIKKDIRLNMPNHLFMPVSRFDLLELLTVQDKIANKVKDVAGLIYSRHMVLPIEMREMYLNLVKRVEDTNKQALQAVHKLDELLDTGFTGYEARLVRAMIHHLDILEDDTDCIHRDLCMQLFAQEKSLPPIDVIFMYKVLEWTADIANRAQRVGHRLQLLLAK